MNSDVDTSILNSVNIKRFTKSVLEEYEAEIDRSNSAKWEVTFPKTLSQQLDRKQGTLVFDATDRERGTGDLLVQPGTTVFSALLDLVQQPGSVGHLRLTENSLQVNPPTVLQESDLAVEINEFSERTSDFALVFHFRVQFETPSSFHSEEMFSVTMDPETQTRLPELTKRLTSHLPQLLQQNNESSPHEVSREQVQEAFDEAQQAIIDRSRPIIADLREEADDSASERIEEISDWHEQRRDELEQQLAEQRREIQKWKNKRQNARKDSTRRRYVKNRKKSEKEFNRLQEEIQKKKQELNTKESEEIDQVINRNEIGVDVSLLGVTEVSYVRGNLALNLHSEHADADIQISYLPATDEFRGLNCNVCSSDLTKGVLPQLCENGHLIGAPCASSCRSCGLTYCDDCGNNNQFKTCVVCWEDICQDCVGTCSLCGCFICDDHADDCDTCGSITCHLCGEGCSTCDTYCCDSHLTRCSACESLHCDQHISSCDLCGAARCENDLESCSECGDQLCSKHSISCDTCDDILCVEHSEVCAVCLDSAGGEHQTFCQRHAVLCSVGDEVICSNHRVPKTIGSGQICHKHRTTCDSCKVGYSETAVSDGQCTACQSLGEVKQEHVPDEITSEFRTVEAGSNEAYMVVLGKKLLGRNKMVVYDIQSEEETDRHSAGMLKQFLGDYK